MGNPREGFLLFVYGTLCRGGGKEGLLDGARFLRPATVEGSMYDLGSWPALVLDGAGPVHGEVWRCPPRLLRILDDYEGVEEGLFERVRIDLGEEGSGWAYVAGPSLSARLAGHDRIVSGRWHRAGDAGS